MLYYNHEIMIRFFLSKLYSTMLEFEDWKFDFVPLLILKKKHSTKA